LLQFAAAFSNFGMRAWLADSSITMSCGLVQLDAALHAFCCVFWYKWYVGRVEGRVQGSWCVLAPSAQVVHMTSMQGHLQLASYMSNARGFTHSSRETCLLHW
jgi:hypothetical protein